MSADSLKPKHVAALVERWKEERIATGNARQGRRRLTAISLRLEAAFGLRREESIKIIPAWADRGDVLRLKDTWTRGGRYRELPITTATRRAVLDAAKALANGGSLIPEHLSYRDQLNRFWAQCDKAGIHGVHGLRHQYAQERYETLPG